MSIRPYFILFKYSKIKKTKFATGETVDLAERIIDHTCRVTFLFQLPGDVITLPLRTDMMESKEMKELRLRIQDSEAKKMVSRFDREKKRTNKMVRFSACDIGSQYEDGSSEEI